MARPRFDDEDLAWASARPRRKKRRRSAGIHFDWLWNLNPIFMVMGFLGLIALALAALSFVWPKAAQGTLAIGILFIVAGWVLFYGAALSEGIGYALACFFVPFFSLYYFLTRLNETWRSIVVSFAGVALIMVSFATEAIRSPAPGLQGVSNRDDRTPGPAVNEPAPPRQQFMKDQLDGSKAEAPPELPVAVDPALQNDESRVFLSDLKMYSVKNGPWPVTAGNTGAPDRAPILVNNKESKHGISMHPPDSSQGVAGASFAIGGAAKRFKGWAALNQYRMQPWSPVRFTIRGDGRVLWEVRDMDRSKKPAEFDIDVSRVKVLTLETAAGHHLHAHAVWFEPHLEK